ncbi:MAG: hypothetical protein ACR2PK_13690, partial [Acidimicrobiales bacterium]
LWIGLAVVPLVALVLARLARCIVEIVATEGVRTFPQQASPSRAVGADVFANPAVTLRYSLVRRGPPLVVAF